MKNRMREVIYSAFFFLLSTSSVYAASYSTPPAYESLVGDMQYSSAGANETVVTLQTQYDLGYNALENANPQLDLSRPIPYGSSVVIPTQHLLPNQPRVGIVINLPEMRMYYYPRGSGQVLTYPIGIGKVGKTIPITQAYVTTKKRDPVWTPTDAIKQFNLEKGIILPESMPPGPDNPLGSYAIYMTIPTYLIHSSPFTESIGKRASFGCIRMYESDIEDFFPSVENRTPVAIINQPTKAGWQDDRLYLEAHTPLQEHGETFEATLPGMVHLVTRMSSNKPSMIDWQLISFISKERDGIPHEVGFRLN